MPFLLSPLLTSILLSCQHTPPQLPVLQALVLASQNFQHILRLLNTNVDGRVKIVYALTKIRGVGRRYATIICKKADVDTTKRAGEISEAEIERIITIMQNPRQVRAAAAVLVVGGWCWYMRWAYGAGNLSFIFIFIYNYMYIWVERWESLPCST